MEALARFGRALRIAVDGKLHDTRAKKRAGSRGTGSAYHGNHLFHKHSLETAAPLRAASTLSASLKLCPPSSPLSAGVCDPHRWKASVRASPGWPQCFARCPVVALVNPLVLTRNVFRNLERITGLIRHIYQ